MKTDDDRRAAMARVAEIYVKRPSAAEVTLSGRAVLSDGMTAVYEQGGHSVTADMPEEMGGDATAPKPGFYGRAGLTLCMAVGIKLEFLRAGVTVRRIEIDVAQDCDDRAMHDVAGAGPADPSETRVEVMVDADAGEAEVKAIVDRALEIDMWYLIYRDAQKLVTSVKVPA